MNEWLTFDFQPESEFGDLSTPTWDPTPPGELLAWVHTVLEDIQESGALSSEDARRFADALEALKSVDLSGLPTRYGYGEWDTTPFEEALNEFGGDEDLL